MATKKAPVLEGFRLFNLQPGYGPTISRGQLTAEHMDMLQRDAYQLADFHRGLTAMIGELVPLAKMVGDGRHQLSEGAEAAHALAQTMDIAIEQIANRLDPATWNFAKLGTPSAEG